MVDVTFTPYEGEAAASAALGNGDASEDTDPLQQVAGLLDRPSDVLALEETQLLWSHRLHLAQDGRALVKLLRAVLAFGPAAVAGEGANSSGAGASLTADDAAPEVLVGVWAEQGCRLTTLDAMKLLGG